MQSNNGSKQANIVPIVKIDDATIGDGTPGDGTRKVMQLFRDYTTAYGQGKV